MGNKISNPRLHPLFSDAYEWLCLRRCKHPPSSDVWDFRRNWKEIKEFVIEDFTKGTYKLSVQKKLTLSCGDTIAIWSSRDALVIKVLTAIIQEALKPYLSKTCYHLKGHGGLKGAVRDLIKLYPKYSFFCKTDVRSYYDSIDHFILYTKLYDYISENTRGYVWQFLNRCVEWGGLYQDIKRGIPRGASLSPLLGAFYLLDLDRKMARLDVKYVRYMDDILILAKTRWKLKKAIKVLNQTFDELKLEKHPDKTVIGRVEKGFDFLGYHISPEGLSLAKKTIENFIARAIRLYEQEPREPYGSYRLGLYVRRWCRWSRAGLRPPC
jgi:RNA-directed DNA polymerase